MADRDRETSLWGWLKRGLAALCVPHHVRRMENLVAKGTPDVEGCIAGDTFWTELKVAYPMAKDMVRVKITVDQARWALKRARAGGRSWVLVRVTGSTPASTFHYLVRGQDAEELLEPVSSCRLAELSAAQPRSTAVELLKTMVGR